MLMPMQVVGVAGKVRNADDLNKKLPMVRL
jgi:hypothetical protein